MSTHGLADERVDRIAIAHEGWTLALSGATSRLLNCAYRNVEILRPSSAADAHDNPFHAAHFPLAPYSNRIRDGRFSFDGVDYKLPANVGGTNHPMHGVAWQGDWRLVEQNNRRVELRLDHHGGPEWPWPFRLRQVVRVARGVLEVELAITNTSSGRAPAGLGFHPYFSNPASASIAFGAEGYWGADADNLPDKWRPASGDWDFSSGKTLRASTVDNCFTGWNGRARITWSDRPFAVELETDPSLAFAVLFVSQDLNCFCFEPVSHMNNALNAKTERPTGRRALEPGEEWSVKMRMRVAEQR